MNRKWVYFFSQGESDGNASMREILGGKGANLAEMASIGLPVPPGFTIAAEACNDFYANRNAINTEIIEQAEEALFRLEKLKGAKFGDPANPLLFSIRSGARVSMPGMMDTILNVGLNDQTVTALAKKTNNRWFALDSYRRLMQMYGDVVCGIEGHEFEDCLTEVKIKYSVLDERDLPENGVEEIIEGYKNIYSSNGIEFPQDVREQLWSSIKAVFGSWMNERAVVYRRIHKIPGDWGTAVNIQTMVFGNYGQTSATGVFFTRNPSNGDNHIFGEYLINAQGEDVVAGTRTPAPLSIRNKEESFSELDALEAVMPKTYKELASVGQKLEKHFKEVQDIEFTIQEEKLWMLQTRTAKMGATAVVKSACDMVAEGLITKEQAVRKVTPEQVEKLMYPTISIDKTKYKVLATGLPAAPGAVCGIACFNSQRAETMAKKSNVILIRKETSPEDIAGMHSAVGILTCRGGMTSHAAVVARGMGKSCVVGATALNVEEEAGVLKVGSYTIKEGEKITINGSTGEIILGEVKTSLPEISVELKQILAWADEIRALKVRANADTKADALTAIKFGAQGIGLCRTEHMFFHADRISWIRKMILSTSDAEREHCLEKLFSFQKADFKEIFDVMSGLPVTIRLLDPPLHEFLPQHDHEIEEMAKEFAMKYDSLKKRIMELREANPMLGHRGCRLAISNPEIYVMQVRAIFEAASEMKNAPKIEVMLPLINNLNEYEYLYRILSQEIHEIEKLNGAKFDYLFGSMIELPSAAMIADKLAVDCDFFSFGTNDLTQTTLGLSRDDSSRFMHYYLEKQILKNDPFATIDTETVGEIMKISISKAKAVKPDIKLGVCGEHGGDPESIQFFNTIGLDYISCSPFRIPIARLAAAHAKLKAK